MIAVKTGANNKIIEGLRMEQTKTKRTEITIETHSLTIIRTRSGQEANLVSCGNCGTNAASFRHAHAALIFHATAAELERLSRGKQIHYADNAELCANSLAAFFNREIRCIED